MKATLKRGQLMDLGVPGALRRSHGAVLLELAWKSIRENPSQSGFRLFQGVAYPLSEAGYLEGVPLAVRLSTGSRIRFINAQHSSRLRLR